MSSGPDLALAFRLRTPGGAGEAGEWIAEGARKYRGFRISSQDEDALVIDHLDFEFYVQTFKEFLGRGTGSDEGLVILYADSD